MFNPDHVRAVVQGLPGAREGMVRGRLKWRVGTIVFAAYTHDKTQLGVAFPREERDAALRADPLVFRPPRRVDERYNWIEVAVEPVSPDVMAELVVDGWMMAAPRRLRETFDPVRYVASEPWNG